MKSADDGRLLLSIAIPTKNRQPFVINLVDELLRSESRDFEVIIQDNSDDNSLAAYAAGLQDSRIRYDYIREWVSVVDNCDAALRMCSGHYVCMLGDDDGVMLDEALEMLANARTAGVDAIMTDVVLYTWPDLGHHSIRNLEGKLYLRPLFGRRKADFRAAFRRVVKRSGAMGLEGLPCVYQGFVARSILAAVHEKTGSCFPGPSPDMANAIGIGTVLSKTDYVRRPLIIAGHSSNSAAGKGTMKQHKGAIAEQKHLPADTAGTWYPQIPFFWSGPTIYAQSLRRALERTGKAGSVRPNDACLYAATLIFERSYWREVLRALRHSNSSVWSLAPRMAYYAVLISFKRAFQLKNSLMVRFFPDKASIPASSIADAISKLRALGVGGFPRGV